MKRKILVASTNPGKMTELRAILEGDVQWVGLSDFSGIEEVEEDGVSFAENARKKACGYAKATGLWTIADDSGLVVDALGGEPGVRSARYSGEKLHGEERTLIDHRNIAKVLELLQGVPAQKRTARFVCCLCLASPQEVLLETEGKVEGVITEKEIGSGGFGYDPIVYVPEMGPLGAGKTVAQMTAEEKNGISHRGNAIRKLKPILDELLSRV